MSKFLLQTTSSMEYINGINELLGTDTMTLQAKQFGIILKNARKAHNLTQAELAEILDISLPYVKDLERSRSNPSYEMFERIIRYFHLSADEIFYPDSRVENSTRKKIERLLTCCDEQQLLVILATLTALLGVDKD